ncbi:MAG: TetR/AcrR family transcriptional regulator [Proteobacteria bacterium]|nr:TetR/AcrR family transcriptional regulator [Pseudomonadota bacterium]
MGVAERRRREKEARISLILKHAGRLFSKQGFENTSMEDIARAAEVATGTLYLYFKSKEDLFYSLLTPMFRLNHDGLARTTSDEAEPADATLRRIADLFHESYRAEPDILRILWSYDAARYQTVMSDTNQERMVEAIRQHVRVMERLVERGMAQGRFRPVDSRVTAILIWSMFMGIFQYENNRRHLRGSDHLQETLRASVEFILSSLLSGPDRAGGG